MKKLLLIALALLLYLQVPAQNYKFQALFIFNIAQRIEWPSIANEFIIGVAGSNEIMQELENISTKRQLFGHKIKIVQLSTSNPKVDHCHLVYLGRSSSSKIDNMIPVIKNRPILLVGDKKGIKGAHINFLDTPGKIEFEVYPNSIKSQKLKVANSLYELGIVRD